jgi:hypothetical protein
MKTSPDSLAVYRTESGHKLGILYRKEWLSIGPRGVKGFAVVQVDGLAAADAADTWGTHICAAVNACAGIATQALQPGLLENLLAALEAVLPFAENEEASLYECWKRNGDGDYDETLTACTAALDAARAILAKAGRRPL